MDEELKKDCWKIPVRREVLLKVYFEEPLTMDEALEAFSQEQYNDIMDEDVTDEEVLDWAE